MIPTCTWCASDAYVDDYDEVNDLALCTGPGHGEQRMFQPKAEHAAQKAHQNSPSYLSDGIAADLGLYDTLPDLLNPGEWADTPTVEYRLGIQEPDTYRVLLDRWGHVSQGPGSTAPRRSSAPRSVSCREPRTSPTGPGRAPGSSRATRRSASGPSSRSPPRRPS